MNSELRQDIVSGDWIVIAPGRFKRPHQVVKKEVKRKREPIKNCPFEDPKKSGNPDPIVVYPNKHKWAVQIIPNRYPAVSHNAVMSVVARRGPYSVFPGVGHHDLVITRDHDRNFPHLTKSEAIQVFQAFRERYLMLFEDKYVAYLSIFHNWGPAAGASIYHPHYQMIGIPVVPPDVSHSLEGSARYFKKYKKCVHCLMIEWEQKEGRRVVFENDGAIAFAPFVSRSPFEIRIFPKKHLPYFENTYDYDFEDVVIALQRALRSVEKKLNDADYNFFIHTAPIKNKNEYRHYHWHIEILPKTAIQAGFELGTGVEINVVDPDTAAKLLRI
jgi:UDPglucose--hexose-1-phosphate uridylyltransferase